MASTLSIDGYNTAGYIEVVEIVYEADPSRTRALEKSDGLEHIAPVGTQFSPAQIQSLKSSHPTHAVSKIIHHPVHSGATPLEIARMEDRLGGKFKTGTMPANGTKLVVPPGVALPADERTKLLNDPKLSAADRAKLLDQKHPNLTEAEREMFLRNPSLTPDERKKLSSDGRYEPLKTVEADRLKEEQESLHAQFKAGKFLSPHQKEVLLKSDLLSIEERRELSADGRYVANPAMAADNKSKQDEAWRRDHNVPLPDHEADQQWRRDHGYPASQSPDYSNLSHRDQIAEAEKARLLGRQDHGRIEPLQWEDGRVVHPKTETNAMFFGTAAAIVKGGEAVPFKEDGEKAGFIVRSSDTTFTLPAIGRYEVSFKVVSNTIGQLGLALNGMPVHSTVVSSIAKDGGNHLEQTVVINTTSNNSVLSVINPRGNFDTLMVKATSGGAANASATLSIKAV